MNLIRFFFILWVAVAISQFDAYCAPPVPVNDDSANPIDLGTTDAPVLEGTTLGATAAQDEPYSPNLAPPIHYPSVWYKWTAPSAAAISFVSDAGYANVWTYAADGGAPGAILAHDNGSFLSEPGVTYYFAGTTTAFIGPFSARVILGTSPANDSFANAIELKGSDSVEVLGSGQGSTQEADEPGFPFSSGSIWYKWVPTISGHLRYAFASNYISTVYAYRADGPSIKDLVRVAADNERPYLLAGNTYYLAVYGRNPVHFWIHLAPNPPTNDNQDSAITLQMSNNVARVIGTTVGATREPSDPFGPYATVWYKWVPETSGQAFPSVASVEPGVLWYPADVTMYRAEPFPFPLRAVGNMGQGGGVTAGLTYYFMVSTWDNLTEPFELTVTRATSPPNDNFAQASILDGSFSQSFVGLSTVGSTLEPDEPHTPAASGSVWYRYSPGYLGRLFASPSDPGITATLYKGTSLTALQKVDPPDVVPGVNYYLAFETTNPKGVSFDLLLTLCPITGNTNDFFSEAAVITGRSNYLHFASTENASSEPGEPNIGGSLWWKYVPPESGWLIIRPESETMACTLYQGSTLSSLKLLNTGLSLTYVEAGQSYFVQVEHNEFRRGGVQLILHARGK